MIVVRRARLAVAVTPRRGDITIGVRLGQRTGVHTFFFTYAARRRGEQERVAALARVRALREHLEAQLPRYFLAYGDPAGPDGPFETREDMERQAEMLREVAEWNRHAMQVVRERHPELFD